MGIAPIPMGGGGMGASTPKGNPTGQGSKGKGGPAPQDYQAINQKQIAANRPNQSTPFGTSGWHQDANGNWTQDVNFSGPLADVFSNVAGQASAGTSSPLDFSGAPALQYGEDARRAATDAAYNQETSRLNPMWDQREQAERVRLAGQGLDPGSEAFTAAMGDFNRGRNDAFQTAINNSIGLGQSAAGQMFDQSALARQMAVGEMLKKRNQPLQELGQLQGMLQMPSFNPATGMVESARLKDAAERERYESEQAGFNDLLGGLLSLGGTLVGGPAGGAAGGILGKLLGKGSQGPSDYGSVPDISEPVPF